MSRYRLTTGAKATLVDIYNYTLEQWGEDQADKYLNGLFARFEAITKEKTIWRPISPEFEISGYFCRYEKHLIYWRHTDDKITFVAILHASMMQGERLHSAFGLDDFEG